MEAKILFIKDKEKHFVGSIYDKPKYVFLVHEAKRFEIPISIVVN